MEDSLDIVLGIEPPPPANASAQVRDNRRRTNLAYGIIRSSANRSVRTFISSLGHRDPQRAWEAVRARYDTNSSQSGRVTILSRFHTSVMKPSIPVSENISLTYGNPEGRRNSG